MKLLLRRATPYLFWTILGGALGAALFLWMYPSEWFSWPGPGDRSSTTIVLGGLLLATNSLLIYFLLTGGFLGKQSRAIAAGILAFSLVLASAPAAVSLRNPTPLIFGPLKAQSFFVHEGQGVGGGSVRDEVTIFSRESALSLVIADVWTGEKKPLDSAAVAERPVGDCAPMTYCDYRFEHIVEIAAPGAYEIYDSSEPRHRDFFVIRDEQLADSCDIGIVYPNYTWLAYNPAGHENLYSVTPGTWVDYRDPISGNRQDFHTHDVTTNIAKVILKQERCLTPLTNSDIDRTTDWQNLELLVLTGHDEFWTQAMLEQVSSYVSQGGKVAVFAGNVAYKEIQFDDQSMRHASKWGESNTPEELVLGSAFRFAGYDLLDNFTQAEARSKGLDESYYRDSEGMYVENPGHPIFQNTGLAKGQLFGKSSRLHFQEMDGVPLDGDSLKIDTSRYSGPVTDEGILAYGFATYGGGINTHGAIVEFDRGPGRVVNAGSLNWGNAVAKDRVVERITLNVISYLRQSE
jgi:hypothetical protein